MIGVFDSGVGGLSVLRHLCAFSPGVPVTYVADSQCFPYGNLSTAVIRQRCQLVFDFLIEQCQAKMLVMACNTATVMASDFLRKFCPVPVVAVEPGLKPAVKVTRCKAVGVLATNNTKNSVRFKHALAFYRRFGVEFFCPDCTGLAELIEYGLQDERFLARLLDPLIDEGVDTIVLGCTHYVLAMQKIKAYFAAQRVALIDTSEAVARQILRVMKQDVLLEPYQGRVDLSDVVFWSSANQDGLSNSILRQFDQSIEVKPLSLI